MIGVNSNHRNVEDVNNLLPWHTKSKLSNGRTIGKSPTLNKRNYFEEIPDKRITQLHELIDYPIEEMDTQKVLTNIEKFRWLTNG